MKCSIGQFATLWVAAAGCGWAAEASLFTCEPTPAATEWTIKYEGRKLLVYSFAPQKFKPYVQELCTLQGYNILRDAPHDHLHHHALMYGIKVNGINFWEEVSGSGVQKPVTSSSPEFSANAAGLPQAKLAQTIHWVAPQDAFLPDASKEALLVEERTLTLTVNQTAHEAALHWKSKFQVGGKTNQVTLTGANYHGLGMRFRVELDPLAKHLNAGGAPDLADNKQDVSRHAWGAVLFDQAGQPITVILAGHPSNPRGNASFFTMRTPFAYLSATQGLEKEPLVYHSGDRFELNYLVILYPELKTASAIQQRVNQWVTLNP
jgi:hypothetical protein